jgi:hypothetical protein
MHTDIWNGPHILHACEALAVLRFRHMSHHFLTPRDRPDISVSSLALCSKRRAAECSIKGCIKDQKWTRCKDHCSSCPPNCTVLYCTVLYSNFLWLQTIWWSGKLEWWGQHKLLWSLLEQTKLRELYSLRNHSPRFTSFRKDFSLSFIFTSTKWFCPTQRL